MLKFRQALKIVLGDTKPMGWEWVSLSRAHRRVLAKDVIAQNNIPYTDNSAMDGYAVNTGNLKSALQELPVVGVVACGKSVNKRLKRGEAMAIMTGAPIPAGCNSVVPVEDTEVVSSGIVRILRKIEPGGRSGFEQRHRRRRSRIGDARFCREEESKGFSKTSRGHISYR